MKFCTFFSSTDVPILARPCGVPGAGEGRWGGWEWFLQGARSQLRPGNGHPLWCATTGRRHWTWESGDLRFMLLPSHSLTDRDVDQFWSCMLHASFPSWAILVGSQQLVGPATTFQLRSGFAGWKIIQCQLWSVPLRPPWVPPDVLLDIWFGHCSLTVGTQSASNRRSLGRSMARGRTCCGRPRMHSSGNCCAGRKSCKVQLLRSRRSCWKVYISKLCLDAAMDVPYVPLSYRVIYRVPSYLGQEVDLQTDVTEARRTEDTSSIYQLHVRWPKNWRMSYWTVAAQPWRHEK